MTFFERVSTLKHLCPEYAATIDKGWLPFLYMKNPPLYIASSVYIFCDKERCSKTEGLIFELDTWAREPNAETIIPEACAHLVRFFAESNEPECTMMTLRWMRENGYTSTEENPLRL